MTPLGPHTVQLDETHSLEWLFAYDPSTYEPIPNELRVGGRLVVGAIHRHQTPEGRTCEGVIRFAKPKKPSANEASRPVWTVHSTSPLTLFPSLLCTECKDHGWVREGGWTPA